MENARPRMLRVMRAIVIRFPVPGSRFPSAEREGQFDGDDDRHRLTLPHARAEFPHLRGLDRFLIEPENRIERARDLDLADAAIRHDDALQPDGALDFG